MSRNTNIKVLVEALVDEVVKAIRKEQVYVPRPRNPIQQSEPSLVSSSGNSLKTDIINSIQVDKELLKSVEEEMMSDATSPEELRQYTVAKGILVKTIVEKERMISSINKVDKVKLS